MFKSKGQSRGTRSTVPNGWLHDHAAYMNRLAELQPNEHYKRRNDFDRLLREAGCRAYADMMWSELTPAGPSQPYPPPVDPPPKVEIAALRAILTGLERVYVPALESPGPTAELKELDKLHSRATRAAKERLRKLNGEAPSTKSQRKLKRLPPLTDREERLHPLTDREKEVYRLIADQPPGNAITGKEICSKTGMRQGTLTSHIIPKLKRSHGIQNRPGAGYYKGS
jgi:DNA-binding CsgD family transcriptional regulator